MLLSTIFLLGALASGIEAVTFSSLAQVNINLTQNATFTISVSNLTTDDMLSWMVGAMNVANLSLTGGALQLDGGMTMNDSIYEVTTNGNDTTLTLISPDLTFNGSAVKLTDGTVDSDIATLIITVVCGPPAAGAAASCNDVGCSATGTMNDTSVNGKYKICNNTYSCGEDGNWNVDNSACTELICDETGKWGENCTGNCSGGCPMMTCFANGSCADASYMNIASCKDGYSGDTCGQAMVAPTSKSTQSTSSTGSETPSSSTQTPTMTDATQSTPEASTPTTTSAPPLQACKAPPSQTAPSQNCTPGENVTGDCETFPDKVETCEWICNENGTWNNTGECQFYCRGNLVWGPKCQNPCGSGCRDSVNGTIRCDSVTGRCVDPTTGEMKGKGECLEGYRGDNCEQPICEQDCQGGTCLAPNFCGNCPKHYEHGPTCRNIRLDGFLKGSLPSLAILAFIVILLTASSKLYIRHKIKEA